MCGVIPLTPHTRLQGVVWDGFNFLKLKRIKYVNWYNVHCVSSRMLVKLYVNPKGTPCISGM
jgi:hypothetical protein